MGKNVFFSVLIFVHCLSMGQSVKPDTVFKSKNWIKFSWESTVLGDRTFEKAAMMVPFQIVGIKQAFRLQLDLGAPNSMLYGNSLKIFLEQNPWLSAKLDTVDKRFLIENQKNGGLKHLDIQLDGKGFTLDDIAFFKDYGTSLNQDSINSNGVHDIGTLGASFFKDRILLIDYPHARFFIADTLDKLTEGEFEFVDCKYDYGRLKIPYTIDGTTYWLLFDTGASLFPIMTNEPYYKQFTSDTKVDSLEISSWGQKIKVFGKKLSKSIMLGHASLPENTVYMIPGNDWDDFYKQEKIIGVTGNAYFLNSIIAIDFKHKKFGLYRK